MVRREAGREVGYLGQRSWMVRKWGLFIIYDSEETAGHTLLVGFHPVPLMMSQVAAVWNGCRCLSKYYYHEVIATKK